MPNNVLNQVHRYRQAGRQESVAGGITARHWGRTVMGVATKGTTKGRRCRQQGTHSRRGPCKAKRWQVMGTGEMFGRQAMGTGTITQPGQAARAQWQAGNNKERNKGVITNKN